MYKAFISAVALLLSVAASSQHILKIKIVHAETKQPLPGASAYIQSMENGSVADSTGIVSLKVITGNFNLIVSHIGFASKQIQITIPNSEPILIAELEPEDEEEEEVIVQSTRTSRTIKNSPTRVETINGEELDEKNNMRPANVSMLLHESTGLQVQQTSAATGNASIRVQGLDGRYTQLLKDGYPNFGNFASGLSILEIPPLDLKQVEVIKGPASTLYGGGAIAGVINFVSKMPKEKFEGDFILNQSNVGQTNIGGYISQKKKKMGYSVLAAVNFSKAYDVDNDQFSEIPKSENFTINPRLFFYPAENTSIQIAHAHTQSNSNGGDMEVIKGNANAAHVYFENNKTIRNTTTLEVERKINAKSHFKLKQSLSLFNREIAIPSFRFAGANTNSFTDISYTTNKEKHTVIAGLNLIHDKFTQKENSPGINQNARSFTAGLYLQDVWDITDKLKLESGMRFDNATYRTINFTQNQFFLLPRFSALFIINTKLTSRIGAGLGYKMPTIFTEQTEALQYQNVLPLTNVSAERSVGGTADINYKTNLAEGLSFSINQLFFATSISKPLLLQRTILGNLFFANAAKPVVSKGFETNLKFIYKHDLKLFVGYTFTNAKALYKSGNQFLALVPKNKVNLTLMYEKEDNFKLGVEGYLTDRQYLTNGNRTPSFWEFGFMAQKTFKKISAFINFENFTDQRQSKYKRVVNPPNNNPAFDEIWNHTEGFVFNGGIKIKV